MAIEVELGRDAVSTVDTITEIAEYLRVGGGKRIRPSLLLLAARCLGYTGFIYAASLALAANIPLSSHCAPALHLPVCCHVPGLLHMAIARSPLAHARISRADVSAALD